MLYATLQSLRPWSACPPGLPNQRLHALAMQEIRPPGSATGPLGANSASPRDFRSAMDTLAAGSYRTASWSRPDDRLATTLAVTAGTHSVQYVGSPRLPGIDPPCASSKVRYRPHPPSTAKIINMVAGRLHPPPSVQHTPKPLIHKVFAQSDGLNHPSASCCLLVRPVVPVKP